MPLMKNSRTKLQLWNSLYDLIFMQRVEFNQITINDICTNAIVHRSTFYNHFTDKFALYKFGYAHLCEKKNVYSVYQRMFAPFRTASDINQLLNESFFNNDLMSSSYPDFINQLQSAELSEIIDELTPLGYELTVSKNLLLDLILSLHTVLDKHIKRKELTITAADSIIEKQINQLIIRASTSKIVAE